MSVITIIFFAISIFIYVAKQVEKQNTAEQKRREERRKRLAKAPTQAARPHLSDQKREKMALPLETLSSQIRSRYQEAQEKIQKADKAPVAKPPLTPSHRTGSRPEWLSDRQAVRRAFLFAECIGKPRAVEPHRFFKR